MKLIRMNSGMELIFCMWLGIPKYIYLIQFSHIVEVRHTLRYVKTELSCDHEFLLMVRNNILIQ